MSASHGTRSGYVGGCRCDDCRAANSEYARALRKKRTTKHHGTISGYVNYGCRCAPCTEAGRQKNAADAAARNGKEPPQHGLYGSKHYGCRCEICRAAHAAYMLPRSREEQAASLADATRHYVEWTGPDLEIAARDDLTLKQKAAMLGRTVAAVRNMRAKLKTDPRKINAAGLGTQEDS